MNDDHQPEDRQLQDAYARLGTALLPPPDVAVSVEREVGARRRRRRTAIAGAAVLVVAGAVGGAVVLGSGDDQDGDTVAVDQPGAAGLVRADPAGRLDVRRSTTSPCSCDTDRLPEPTTVGPHPIPWRSACSSAARRRQRSSWPASRWLCPPVALGYAAGTIGTAGPGQQRRHLTEGEERLPEDERPVEEGRRVAAGRNGSCGRRRVMHGRGRCTWRAGHRDRLRLRPGDTHGGTPARLHQRHRVGHPDRRGHLLPDAGGGSQHRRPDPDVRLHQQHRRPRSRAPTGTSRAPAARPERSRCRPTSTTRPCRTTWRSLIVIS